MVDISILNFRWVIYRRHQCDCHKLTNLFRLSVTHAGQFSLRSVVAVTQHYGAETIVVWLVWCLAMQSQSHKTYLRLYIQSRVHSHVYDYPLMSHNWSRDLVASCDWLADIGRNCHMSIHTKLTDYKDIFRIYYPVFDCASSSPRSAFPWSSGNSANALAGPLMIRGPLHCVWYGDCRLSSKIIVVLPTNRCRMIAIYCRVTCPAKARCQMKWDI